MRRSTRLARFLGSRRIIQIRLDRDALLQDRNGVLGFLKQKFVLGGRVFMPIPPKDDAVYLVEVNEDYERVGAEWCGDKWRMSFGEIMDWHNPFELNSAQVCVECNVICGVSEEEFCSRSPSTLHALRLRCRHPSLPWSLKRTGFTTSTMRVRVVFLSLLHGALTS